MMAWLWCALRYGGHLFEFQQNVYGDRILALGCRSVWKCAHCPKRDYRKELHHD